MKAHLVRKKITDRNGKATTVWVKMSGMDIPRNEMPQIRGEKFESFKKFLKDNNVIMTDEEIQPDRLRPTQKHVDQKKVDAMAFAEKGYRSEKRVLVSGDMYIVDGHHRWASDLKEGEAKTPCRVIHMKIKPLLKLIATWPGVEYHDLNHRSDKVKEAIKKMGK